MKDLRESLKETQAQFAKRIGIGVRSVKRHEAESTLPSSEAVLRQLRTLADVQQISLEK